MHPLKLLLFGAVLMPLALAQFAAAKTITVNVAGIGNVTQPLALTAPTFKRFGALEA